MQVQDARRIREAFEDVIAAVDRTAPCATHQELVRLGDQLEVIGRTLTSMATARLVETTAAGDDAQEQRSHPMREGDR